MSVAMADGELHPKEGRLIQLMADAWGMERELVTLEPVEPETLAEHMSDPAIRRAFVQRLVVLTTLDGEVTLDEIAAVDAYARALEVDERAIENLRQLAAGHIRRMAFDLGRRSFAPTLLGRIWHQRGIAGLWDLVKTAAGLTNAEREARFSALGQLPEGTFGRALYHQYVDNEFPYPGQKHGPPDDMLFHDVGHVLAGYGTTPDEELLVAGFQAGYMKTDELVMYLMIAMLFQLAVEPIARARGVEPARDMLDVDRYLDAVERGRAMNVDLLEWDPWPHMERDLDEVRAELGIPAARSG